MHSFKQRIEIGPWFEAGQKIGPHEVQSRLISSKKNASKQQRPYCIYVHVPFCPSRCEYCALYTYEVKHNQDEILGEYLDMVKKAIVNHPNALSLKPPTTVHLGGGTPLFLGVKRFSELTRVLRNTFGDSPHCEWAVETTTSSIDSEIMSLLKEQRLKRLHLGIQTLNNKIREKIKRRETGEKAIEKISLLNKNGFLLSVDLIIGFDEQTELILKDDLNRLYEAGIRMFSICELRILRKKAGNYRKHQEEIKRNYQLWCLLWQFMEEHKLIPIHLGQFGRNFKDNLYYTHPARGEDCISIGPYAHGSAANMVYGNKLLPDYYDALETNQPPIAFGVVYDEEIQKIRKLESQLLANCVLKKVAAELKSIYDESFECLWNFWLENKLLLECEDGESFKPSRDGSWYIGNMILQLRQLASKKES